MENTPNYTDLLGNEVQFNIRSRGMNVKKIGIFLGVIPRNTTLDTATVKVADHDFTRFRGAATIRKRADVAVVLVVEDGKTKYFTPRLQQLR